MTVVVRRRKPIDVPMVQWTGDNEAEVIAFTGPGVFRAIPAAERISTPEITASVYDRLHDSWIGVYIGQHIVKGGRGEHYPIDETAIADDYDPPETGDFFQVGHVYAREHRGRRYVEFRVTAVDTSPDGEQRLARGWRTDAWHGWEPTDSDDMGGWTDVTEEVTR